MLAEDSTRPAHTAARHHGKERDFFDMKKLIITLYALAAIAVVAQVRVNPTSGDVTAITFAGNGFAITNVQATNIVGLDEFGGGDFLADGSVPMDGTLQMGSNNITNAGTVYAELLSGPIAGALTNRVSYATNAGLSE